MPQISLKHYLGPLNLRQLVDYIFATYVYKVYLKYAIQDYASLDSNSTPSVPNHKAQTDTKIELQ